MDGSKLEAVQNWPQPLTIKSLMGFLGLTGYYRKFIQNYRGIAAPLTTVLKKNSFHWSTAAVSAFNSLKQALTTRPVLAQPDFSQSFQVECDASST